MNEEQNQKKPTTLEDALNQRLQEENKQEIVPPEPTEDEILTQALGNLSAQGRFGQQPPQMTGPISGQKINPMIGNPLPRNIPTTKENQKSIEGEPSQQKNSLEFPIQENNPKQETPTETISIQPGMDVHATKINLSEMMSGLDKELTISIQPETMGDSAASSHLEMATTPVSNTSPQPVSSDSTPESQEKPRKKLIINTDAAMIKNPGLAAIAVIIRDESGEIISRISTKIGETTNNVAEYRGILAAIYYARRCDDVTEVEIRTDSELVVKQCNGEYRCNDPVLHNMRAEVIQLMRDASRRYELVHVPREQNKEADELARQTIQGGIGTWLNPGQPEKNNTLTEETLIEMCNGFSNQTQNKDINLRRLIEFVKSGEYTVDWVRMHLGYISRMPSVIPSLTLWEGTNFEEVACGIHATVMTPGYIENTWPVLSKIMGSSRDNTEWAAGVLTTIALFDTIKMWPFGEGQK